MSERSESRRALFRRTTSSVVALDQRLPRIKAPTGGLRALLAPRPPSVPLPLGVPGTKSVREMFGSPASAPPPDLAEVERRLAEVRAEAERAGAEQMRVRLDAIEARLAGSLERLDHAAQQGTRPAAREIIELAMAAAAEIVGREVRVDRERLVGVIEEALEVVDDDRAGTVTVRLAPEDLAWIREHHAIGFGSVKLVEDEGLDEGGCIVESARKVVDASIEARIEAVRRAIHDALSEDG